MIQVQFLDHVAIKARDVATSAQWYEKVLGLKRYTFNEWGDYPVLMLVGKTGVAIFPGTRKSILASGDALRIHHFAFNVEWAYFAQAQQHLDELGIVYEFQDHHFFHSIYLRDPDGHQVELTTLVVAEGQFYT